MTLQDSNDFEKFLSSVDQISKCCLFIFGLCLSLPIMECYALRRVSTYRFLHFKLINCCVITDELVKGFQSSDVSCREEALEKADQLIASLEQKEACKTKINKTVINTNPSSENKPLVQYSSPALYKQCEWVLKSRLLAFV